tara:strand:- start:69 stop:503 length:435 start_codon:yes stop_codon:yes gene_type:complete
MSAVAKVVKEVVETIRHRVKNEIFFNFVVVWLAWNQKHLFMIFFLKDDKLRQQAMLEFNAVPWCESSGMPLLIAIGAVFIHPWINWFVARYKNELVEPKLAEQREMPKRLRIKAEEETILIIEGYDSTHQLAHELRQFKDEHYM